METEVILLPYPRKTSVHSLEEIEKVDSEILQAPSKKSIQFFARPKAISASSLHLKGAIAYGKHGEFPVGYEQTEEHAKRSHSIAYGHVGAKLDSSGIEHVLETESGEGTSEKRETA